MLYIRIAFDGVLALLTAYYAYEVYRGYRAATGTTWQRLLAGARGSATMLWAKFCVGLSLVVGNLDSLADALGQPDAKQYIADAIGNPRIVASVMLGLTAVTMFARMRTLVK